jgi:hypothetical protein
MLNRAKGFGLRLTGMILAFVALGIAVLALIFGLIGWQKGRPLK